MENGKTLLVASCKLSGWLGYFRKGKKLTIGYSNAASNDERMLK
jgi:hypothetical protein